MEKKLILALALSCFAMQNFATGNPNVTTSSNLPNSQKVIAYSKDGILYRSEMYIGNNNTPALVNEYIEGELPKDIKKHVYNSFTAFMQAKPDLDSNYAHMMLKAKGSTMKTSNAANEVAYAFDPSVNIFAHVGPDQCYKSNPKTGGSSQYSSKMVGLDGNMSLDATLNIDKDLRLFAAGPEELLLANNKFVLNLHYLGKFNYGNYNFIGAVLANLYTGIPSENNVTSNGLGTFNKSRSSFLAQCGSAGIDGFLGGLYASANIKIISTNHKFDYDLKNDFSSSVDLLERLTFKLHSKADIEANIAGVVSTFDFKGDIAFNQPIEGAYTFTDYVGMKIAQNSPYELQCAVSNPVNLTACATYIGNVSTAINSGLLRANGSIPNNPSAVTTLIPFPYGVKIPGITPPQVSFGSKNPYISYSEADNNGLLITDPFSYSVEDSLVKDRNLIFQLRTLAARANFLANSSDFNTREVGGFLKQLANYYNNDANAMLNAGKLCYKDTVDAYSMFPSTECSNTIVLSDNQKVKLSSLPTSVSQLYSKTGQPTKDSLQEFLYKNSIALQYEANYNEEFFGLSDGNDSKNSLDTIRAANQIQFAGVVFYNAAYNSDEFFAGHNNIAGKDKSYFRGYILAGMSRARLGKGEKEDDNTFNGKPGMKWWQFYQPDHNAIRKNEAYDQGKLYFVINDSDLLPFAANRSKTEKVIFNKVIDNMGSTNPEKALTADSTDFTKETSDRLLNLKSSTNSSFIDVNKDLSSNLPEFTYSITSNVVDLVNNREKFGVSCVGGTYLANIDFSKKSSQAELNSKATFGSNNPNDYVCYRPYNGNANDKWTYFKMRQNGNIAYRTKDLEETITLQLKPIAPFF